MVLFSMIWLPQPGKRNHEMHIKFLERGAWGRTFLQKGPPHNSLLFSALSLLFQLLYKGFDIGLGLFFGVATQVVEVSVYYQSRYSQS